MDSRTPFAAAFWAGLAAPIALYADPPQYPIYVAAYSVPLAFATVGNQLGSAFNREAIGHPAMLPVYRSPMLAMHPPHPRDATKRDTSPNSA
jgi:hypothetical protein